MIELIEQMQAYCRRNERQIRIDKFGAIFIKKTIDEPLTHFTAEALVVEINNGREQRCHEELLAAVTRNSQLMSVRLQEAIKESGTCLAQP